MNLNPKPYYMKKTILLVAASLATIVASAQMTSKNGSAILPESGDWSIGVNVNPFLDYVGNIFSDAGADSPSFDWTDGNDWVITGKMMKDANTAYRVRARIGYVSVTDKDYSSTATAGASVERKTSEMNIDLGAGIQKYRGKGRLQGIYGAEARISYGGGSEEWSSEDLNAEVSNGYLTDGGDFVSLSTFGIGVRGFIGAEYFFAPKMSLGGEFGWGLGISSSSEGEITVNNGTPTKVGGGSGFGIDTDNLDGAISLNLYF